MKIDVYDGRSRLRRDFLTVNIISCDVQLVEKTVDFFFFLICQPGSMKFFLVWK